MLDRLPVSRARVMLPLALAMAALLLAACGSGAAADGAAEPGSIEDAADAQARGEGEGEAALDAAAAGAIAALEAAAAAFDECEGSKADVAGLMSELATLQGLAEGGAAEQAALKAAQPVVKALARAHAAGADVGMSGPEISDLARSVDIDVNADDWMETPGCPAEWVANVTYDVVLSGEAMTMTMNYGGHAAFTAGEGDDFTASGPATIDASASVVDCSVSYDIPTTTVQLAGRHGGATISGTLTMGDSSVSGTLTCPSLQQSLPTLPQPGFEAEFSIPAINGGTWSGAGGLTITLTKFG